ncbi:hypothetical protein BSZ21_21960 [Bradyrhizobium canariense]|uniref:AAA family ATPase n=1 Tax=Bradyrhizobium canariense TaxID=255045 RepID=UPI000A18C034|nr:AAA family ATPase [Bradyrhizobium canariense]OSI65048.1 hypothetical protein BSZ21_21960 [Bradyrhizobium canariense]
MTKKHGKTEEQRITYAPMPKKFSDVRPASTEPELDLPDSEEETEDEAETRARPKPRENATAILVAATFEQAVSRKLQRKLAQGRALAVTVVVPTAAWATAIAAYARSEFGDQWCFHTRDGTDRRQNATTGTDEVARDLSRGLSVMGIAADATLLPAALTAGADIAIRIPPPGGEALRTAIRRFAGRSPGEISEGAAAGLDLHQIVAAFRPGTGAKSILRRIEAASAASRGTTERVPALATAIEFGEAQKWGLNLARDIADFRAGAIKSFKDLDRGICLVSPPGYGKSWYPRILAAGCGGLPLVSTSVGSWFANGPGYLDSVVKQARESFALAAALAAPVSILHLDEIDALPNRDTMTDRAREWWNVVVSDVLTLLDSTLAGRANVVVVGSTNAIGRVDPALLRPGRLERIVEIKPPDLAGIVNIVKFHVDGQLKGDLTGVAALLQGATAAEIMYAVRGARRAARHAGRPLTVEDLARAAVPIETIPAARLFRMTVHEAGHAVAASALGLGVVGHVVLRERGGSSGQTVCRFDDADIATRSVLEDRIVATLAGRAAEILFTGAASTGGGGDPASDLGSATIDAAALHASFGMSEHLLYRGAGADLLQHIALDRDLRDRVEADLRRLDARAARLVADHRAAILAVAERLAERRFLGGDEIEGIVRAHPGSAGPGRGAGKPARILQGRGHRGKSDGRPA